MTHAVKVFGVGVAARSLAEITSHSLRNITCVAVDADEQAFELSPIKKQLQQDIEMVFVIAGRGETATVANIASIIAEAARNKQVLTIVVASQSFFSEGEHSLHQTESTMAVLRKSADALISIPDQGLNGHQLDCKLLLAVHGVSELTAPTAYMNHNIADIKAVLNEGHSLTVMGSEVGFGDDRGAMATKKSISFLLSKGVDIRDTQGILVIVVGNQNMLLIEYDEAVSIVYDLAGEKTNITSGIVFDENIGEGIRVTMIVTVGNGK